MDKVQSVQVVRPGGIVAVALLTLLTSINFFFSAIAIVVMQPLLDQFLPEELNWIAYVFITICLVLGCLFLYLTYGLWIGKSWGRTINFWYYILAIPISIGIILIDEALQNPVGIILMLVSAILCVIVARYLDKPEIIAIYDKTRNISFK